MEDHLNITRPDQLQALGDPTRWRILGRLSESAATVQELARALGIAKGTAAHHVRVLQSAGLIRVAETKRIRGVVEKRYARVARQFRLDEGDRELLAKAAGDADLANLPLRQALAEARPSQRRPARRPVDVLRGTRPDAGRAGSAIREARRSARGRVRRWRAGRGGDLRVRRRRLRARLGQQRSRAQLVSLETSTPPDPSRGGARDRRDAEAPEPVAPGRLHEAVDRPDDQPVRRRDHGIALPFLAITILGASAFEMGILGVVRFLPWILFTLPAGVWVDRIRRRPILIGADVARAVLLATDPDRVPRRLADDLAGLRGVVPGGDVGGLLRRRLPVLSARASSSATSWWRATRSSSSPAPRPRSSARPWPASWSRRSGRRSRSSSMR